MTELDKKKNDIIDEEEEIEITMTREDWKLVRKAIKKYEPTVEEIQRYYDIYGWIVTDWDDY